MRSMIKCILIFFLLIFGTASAEAYFESEIEELESLIEECRKKDIPTAYENVGYMTLQRFSEYMAEDEKHNVDPSIIAYNKSAMTQIYNDTKDSLLSLLSG